MQYVTKQGETISDVVLNSTGVIGNWEAVLDSNNYDNWTPDFGAGTVFEIPDGVTTNLQDLQALEDFPGCNGASESIYGLIEQIFEKLLTAQPAKAVVISQQQIIKGIYYRVRQGESIGDVVLNATGDLQNWEAILDANGLDWDTILVAGQQIFIPNGLPLDLNTYRALQLYPANNSSEAGVYELINAIFDVFVTDWILATSFWNDAGRWYDTSFWID